MVIHRDISDATHGKSVADVRRTYLQCIVTPILVVDVSQTKEGSVKYLKVVQQCFKSASQVVQQWSKSDPTAIQK